MWIHTIDADKKELVIAIPLKDFLQKFTGDDFIDKNPQLAIERNHPVPITELQVQAPLLGRVAKSKETAQFVINKDNIDIFILIS
ncbi:hypothetical protein FACS1894172_07830 [Spirochaetia bacterium]|nr:hypothetical protein FACS1894164_06090 [Spirochaetia bacterium]GHU31988.1 hypothetical protein FACS1894172_07830 [Spirochaetia bacterium]